MTKKKTIEDEELEAMRQRALKPFKPSLTDDDIREFEEKVRAESIETMKKQKEKLNDYEKQQIKEKTSFLHHI